MAGQINLYDPSLERKRDWLALGNVVAVAVLLAVAVGAFGYLARLDVAPLAAQASAGQNQLTALRAQLAALEAQASGRKPDARLEAQLTALQADLGLRTEVLDNLRRNMGDVERAAYTDYLRALARQSLNGLWLTEFRVAEAGRLAIGGCTVDPALLPEYIRRLNSEPAFQGQAFANLKIDKEAPLAAGADAPAARCHHQFVLAPMPDASVQASATTSTAADAPGRPG